MNRKFFATLLALAVVSCGGPDIVIDLRGDGGVTDGGTVLSADAGTPTPSGPIVRVEIRCPVQSDSQCQLYAWWGHNRSAAGRGTIAADIDRGELCVWGLDTNAQAGGLGGAWYDTLRENQSVADSPRWLLRLNPVTVAGSPVTGVVVTDSFGTNLFVSKAQLGCP